MPWLDVTDVILDPDFAEEIVVQRQPETIDPHGRVSVQMQGQTIVAVVLNESGELMSNPDERHAPSTIYVFTPFRLRGVSDDPLTGQPCQPDNVLWGGTRYVVRSTEDASRFGQGFIQAVCDAVGAQDTAP